MNHPRCARSTRLHTTRLTMLLVAPKAGAMSRYGSGLCNTFTPSQMPCLHLRRSDLLHRRNRLAKLQRSRPSFLSRAQDAFRRDCRAWPRAAGIGTLRRCSRTRRCAYTGIAFFQPSSALRCAAIAYRSQSRDCTRATSTMGGGGA